MPEIVPEIEHGGVAGQNWSGFVPVARYVPVSDPSAARVSVTDMFVIPAAGPGEDHVPETSSLEGVVSGGPQEPRASAPTASRVIARDLGRSVIESRVGPAGLEPATVGL
jgi:hypothetical protein